MCTFKKLIATSSCYLGVAGFAALLRRGGPLVPHRKTLVYGHASPSKCPCPSVKFCIRSYLGGFSSLIVWFLSPEEFSENHTGKQLIPNSWFSFLYYEKTCKMYSGKASEKESQRHKFQLHFGLSNAFKRKLVVQKMPDLFGWGRQKKSVILLIPLLSMSWKQWLTLLRTPFFPAPPASWSI